MLPAGFFSFAVKVSIGGGAGFIGSHLAKKLKEEGWYVVCADWKENEFMRPEVRSFERLEYDRWML